MGTELSKPSGGDSHASAAAAAAVEAPTQVLAAKWHAWLQDAETLYLRGRFGAYQEVRVLGVFGSCVRVRLLFVSALQNLKFECGGETETKTCGGPTEPLRCMLQFEGRMITLS